jgi:hypothetical protein
MSNGSFIEIIDNYSSLNNVCFVIKSIIMFLRKQVFAETENSINIVCRFKNCIHVVNNKYQGSKYDLPYKSSSFNDYN